MDKRCLLNLLAFLFIFIVSNARSQHFTIAPMSSWVSASEPPLEAQTNAVNTGGYYYLLIEQQEHVSKQESFTHTAYKFLTSEGIQEMADVNISFDPAYQKLIFHKLIVHRQGQMIDQLKRSDIRTIQREQSMDRYIYDGSFTAIINLQDIRVGDVIEYAYTVKGYNPIYNGHISQRIYLNYSLPYEKAIRRIIAPNSTKLYFHYKNGATLPQEEPGKDNSISYTWSSEQVPAFIEDNNNPSWYDPYQSVQITDFENWAEVANWALKHFDLKEAERNALKTRIEEKWKTRDDRTKAVHDAIRFVQDEIRYLGFEGGLNSHKPHGPVKVFDQRFGDCKDKSLLLAMLLQHLDVPAYPMLVSTNTRKYISDNLPSIDAFNHCVVEISYNEKKIYIDPTIASQGGSLEKIYFPNYGKGLVIKEGETQLTTLPESPTGEIHEDDNFELNFLEGQASLTIRTFYKGIDADNQRSYFASNSLESIQKAYVTYYGNLYPEIKEEELLKIEDDRHENILAVEEKYKIPSFWKKNPEKETQNYGEFYSLSLENLVNVSKSSQRKSPYRLSHPTSFQHTIHATLPDWNIDSDEADIAGDAYTYRYEVSYLDDNLTIYHHYRTLNDHVPVADVSTFVRDHQAIMKKLSYTISYDSGVATESGVSWVAIITGIVSFCSAIALVWFLYFKYDPEPPVNGVTEGQPIGGWLILVALGLSFTPLRIIYDIYNTPEFFDQKSWSAFWGVEQWGLFAVFFFEYVYNIFYLLFSVLLIALFFNKRSSLPFLISIFYGTTFAVTLFDTLITLNVTDAYTSAEESEYYKDLIRSFFVAVIWIPYFNFSERVKETFVERIEPTQGPDNTITYSFRN